MPTEMTRGKQQVLFNYLPGKTFDFAKIGAIARVATIRGLIRNDLNTPILLRKVADDARAWQPDFRPTLREDVLGDPARFILIDPREVQSELFPKVLWCQNRACGRVVDCTRGNATMPKSCPRCGRNPLVQLRFVKIHRCGALDPLTPPPCQRCNTTEHIALDTRGAERISNFRWVCRQCGSTTQLFAGRCRQCEWPDSNTNLRNMDIEVHRAGRTFYVHTAVLLNVPQRQLETLFNIPEWPGIAAAKFLGLPEVSGRSLAQFAPSLPAPANATNTGLSGADLDGLLQSGLTAEQMVAQMHELRQQRQRERQESSPSGIMQAVVQRSGVPASIWHRAGQEILESVLPSETGRPTELMTLSPQPPAAQIAGRMGLARLALVSDYPIITASYGFSRAEYQPNQSRLNPFPAEREHGGRFPIFVDQVQADALLLTLDPQRVCEWLTTNGFPPILPNGTNQMDARRAYFVHLLDAISLRETVPATTPQARMVFGLLHTLGHAAVRQAALFCGLDRTSLSEYLLPKTLTLAIYCNHRFGATIGALTALFEQSLAEWLNVLRDSRRCVYDPVCRDRGGNCHACTHLAETSCRYFNLNLSRAFLFGGSDTQLANIRTGYLEMP